MRTILSTLVSLATGPKTVEAAKTSLIVSPYLVIIEKYFFSDWDFLGFLLVLILVDTIMGVQRSWVQRTVSSRGFSRIFIKLCVYANLLILTHVMTHFTVRNEPNQIFKWFDYFMYSCMMAREALSILEHIAFIEPRLVPKLLLKRLALISEEGLAGTLASLPTAEPAAEESVTGCAGKIHMPLTEVTS
jgi:toxin secretion/phage lysis holin